MDTNHTPHVLLMRRLQAGKGWGGLEKLVMEWFDHIDFGKCRVTLAVSKGCQWSYAERLAKSSFPIKLEEHSFSMEGSFRRQFKESLEFFRRMQPSTVVFLQGAFTDFTLAHTLAASIVTGGRVYMHENLGAPLTPERSHKLFGIIPPLELWRRKKIFVRNARSLFAKKILVVSREIKERMVGLWKYPNDKVQVMYHGVDTVQFSPSSEIRSQMRKKLGIGPNDTVIISTARLSAIKRLDRLIDAFAIIARDFPNTWLIMMGGGLLEGDLKKLAASKSCVNKIIFTGLVEDITSYVKASDIFALPSDNEGLSLALLEAMSTGLICLSTDCTGSSEVIAHGENGYIVEKSTEGVLEGLRTILSLSSDAREQMIRNGIQFIHKNFEIKARVKDALSTMQIPHTLN